MLAKRTAAPPPPPAPGPFRGRPLPLELSWDARDCPLPARWVVPKGRRARGAAGHPAAPAFDFCGRMRRVCEDVVARWGVDADRCTAAAEGAEIVV